MDLSRDTQHRLLRDSAHNYAQYNYTITSSVTIRVTPLHDHFVSWGILWGAFLLASGFSLWQVLLENRIMASRRTQVDDGEQGAGGDAESVSTADITRSIFRRLLLLAMLARVVLIPAQIWSWPMWWQFFGDSFPEMIFASSWTLVVTFFVQLVGIATGVGTNTSPGIVIQATAYVVYLFLIITQLFNDVASILLYALLCCIYAALFGTALYYCSRLFSLLQPSLGQHRGLAVRLLTCNIICLFIFAAHTFEYAQIVVAPPRKVYWWWKYGILELIPAVIFLIIMHPSASKADRNLHDPDNAGQRGGIRRVSSNMRRVESVGSAQGTSSGRRPQETTPLLGTPGHGTSDVAS